MHARYGRERRMINIRRKVPRATSASGTTSLKNASRSFLTIFMKKFFTSLLVTPIINLLRRREEEKEKEGDDNDER